MVDTEIKTRGFEVLSQTLGLVDAERFVCLVQRERLDYTQWRQTLFKNLSGEELSQRAVEFQKSEKKQMATDGVTDGVSPMN